MGNKKIFGQEDGKEKAMGKEQSAATATEMSDKERIESDIRQFHENVKEIRITPKNEEVVSLARKYCEDTEYFLGKKDYVTAFGCINYAHGLIDALRKPWGKNCKE